MAYENDDPKGYSGSMKVDLSIIPPVALVHMALALQDGARKYGAFNWRDANVQVMTYMSAKDRHCKAFIDGESHAPDSGVHHLGHDMASSAIVMDAIYSGTLIDNRPKPGGYAKAIKEAEEILRIARERSESHQEVAVDPVNSDGGWIVADPAIRPNVRFDRLWDDGSIGLDICPDNYSARGWVEDVRRGLTNWRPSKEQ